MQLTIFILITLILFTFITFLFSQKKKGKSWAVWLSELFAYYGSFTILSSLLYFLIVESPQIKHNLYLQNEQRRLYFLELLSNKNTSNRVREEAFYKLLNEYQQIDFSGLPITNSSEKYKSSFDFYRCFQKAKNLKIDNSQIIKTTKSKDNRIHTDVTLNNINFTNSSFQYANFDRTLKFRPESFDFWDMSNPERNKHTIMFHFPNLEHVDFSNAILNEIDFNKSILTSVEFNNSMMHQVNFSNAGLLYCDLRGADLLGSDFSNIIIINTKIDSETRFTLIQNFDKIFPVQIF